MNQQLRARLVWCSTTWGPWPVLPNSPSQTPTALALNETVSYLGIGCMLETPQPAGWVRQGGLATPSHYPRKKEVQCPRPKTRWPYRK